MYSVHSQQRAFRKKCYGINVGAHDAFLHQIREKSTDWKVK
jgi:hypothetical protein